MASNRFMGFIVILALLSEILPADLFATPAETTELNPNHPDRYVVQEGDTLWYISGRFLRDPWRWQALWEANPQIHNPHLIYPGDELILSDEYDRPVLRVRRGRAPVKYPPTVRTTPLSKAIPTVPIEAIQPLLRHPRVVTDREIEDAPYIVSIGREHLVGGAGSYVYVRGIKSDAAEVYTIYRRGQVYRNPDVDGGQILGYEALHVGDAALERHGDPATLLLTSTSREVLAGDRAFPLVEYEFKTNFVPRPPEAAVSGKIIAVVDGVRQISQYQMVALNLGRRDGLETGHVLAVYQAGETIRDEWAQPADKDKSQMVKLPAERAGIVMVIRPFERVSYAIVMEATRAMHVTDRVATP